MKNYFSVLILRDFTFTFFIIVDGSILFFFFFTGDTHGQKEAIVDRLMELHNKLQVIITDYQILLQMLISFFKNLAEVSIPFYLKSL